MFFTTKWEYSLLISSQESQVVPTHIPELNQVLTRKIAGYHAKALDKIGSSILLKKI
jgi:hypothetical protein